MTGGSPTPDATGAHRQAPASRGWVVVIPVKGTDNAKSRLGAAVELATAIALDTVTAALGAAPVVVVTSVVAAPSFAALGARVVVDLGGGLNAAVRSGIAAAEGENVAVLLGDLPSLRSDELVAALDAAEAHPRAMVADAEGLGTVLITALRGVEHSPAFGAGSRVAHIAAGYRELPVAAISGLRRDVDTEQQLRSIDAKRLGERTRAIVAATLDGEGPGTPRVTPAPADDPGSNGLR